MPSQRKILLSRWTLSRYFTEVFIAWVTQKDATA